MTQSFLRLAISAGIASLLFLLATVPVFSAQKVLVADELERLAEEHGFSVGGLEQIEEAFGRADGEKLYPRLRLLLENFDHVIVQSPEGGVDRVIVLGEKVPFEPTPPPEPAGAPPPANAAGGDIVVETERRGTQHVVRVTLEGESGGKVERELHVDTGADYLVLPQSLISKLGIDKKDFDVRDMQTANGKVTASIGTLPALWLSGSRISSVETAFIEDARLGDNGLLGMSVLKRYKLTIDDDKNRITLGRKDAAPAKDEIEATGQKPE
jgi:clan AA aspartic protease (TIGR02281 family)